MERRTFLGVGCTCGVSSLMNSFPLLGEEKTEKKQVSIEMNEEQVKNILKFIDTSQDESTKASIFSQLGYECFYSRNLNKWIENYTGDVQAFLDRVNVEKKSKYWESLEFNADRTILTLTGRKVSGCACAYADCPEPPKSLCNYCCKNLQQELFGMLFGQKVEVEITAAFLLGDEQCSTVIHLV